jgi:hypothetical protein
VTGAPPSPNRELLLRVARRLGPVLDELVFVGGQVAELLVTDPAAVRVRATDDVDVVVEVTTRTGYHRLGERLRTLGFREDTSPGAPLCRWRDPDGLPLDVMPLDEAILGFSNRWYGEALRSAARVPIGTGPSIRIPSAPAFVATKWAAFDGRGGGVYYGNGDVEDVVTVVAGRPDLLQELAGAPDEVQRWLAARTAAFLRRDESADVIAGALPDAWTDPATVAAVRRRFEAIAALREGAPPPG